MAHLNRKIGIPSFNMAGKTAIITGGTQGLGFGMACALAPMAPTWSSPPAPSPR